ncbi:UNVERIFIED_CONTAM: hypothetical protein NY100_11600, partial [Prevotella sp. 15_C9]
CRYFDGEKPRFVARNIELHHPECHTSTSQMPHFSAPNATRQRSKCHTSAQQMPHVALAQVWH